MLPRNPVFAYSLCIFGFLFSLYYFYPGYFHYDSLVQYRQARAFVFANWHPPIMAFIWGVFLRVFPFAQPAFPMLLLQQSLFWFALAVWIFILAQRERVFLWVLPIFAFFPSLLIYSGVLLKDIQMGDALFLVFALSFLLKHDLVEGIFKKILFGVTLFLSFYAFCLRHEAVFACLPLFYYWSDLFFVKLKQSYKILFVFYMALIFVLVTSVFDFIIGTINEDPAQQVIFYDLASMSLHEQKMLIPLEFCNDQKHCFEQIQHDFKFTRVDEILGAVVGFNTLEPRGMHYRDVEKAWVVAIFQHPLVYLDERFAFFRGTLFYPPEFYGHLQVTSVYYGIPGAMPKVWVTHSLYICNQMAQFFPLWVWIILNLLALLFLWYRHRGFSVDLRALFSVQLLSGLLMSMSHLFVGAASDFRYNYWLVLVTLFTWLLMILSFRMRMLCKTDS